MTRWLDWGPAVALGLGALVTVGIDTQRATPLRSPLGTAIPLELAAHQGRDVILSVGELAVAAPSAYLMRNYELAPAARETPWFSVYVGYYDRQTQGKTIHSPKNCLPGGGWEALQASLTPISTATGVATVNRYLLQRGTAQALVLYWYQGRGRIQANEYLVKWNLLRDAALRQRSEEALVRIVVPIHESVDSALALASQVAETVIPGLGAALPQ